MPTDTAERNANYQREFRERRKSEGLSQVPVYIPDTKEYRERLRTYAAKLCKEFHK